MRSDFFLLKVLLSLLCSILARAVSCSLLLLVEYASFLAVLFSCDVLLSLLSTILLQFVVLYYYSLSWCLYNLSLQVLCLIIITTGIPVERNYGRNPQASRNLWQRQHYHLPPLASFFYVVFRFLCTIFTWYPSLYTAMFFSGAPATSLLFAHSLLLFFCSDPKGYFLLQRDRRTLAIGTHSAEILFFCSPFTFSGAPATPLLLEHTLRKSSCGM